MHALIIGATGATGKDLLELLLADASFHQVDIFVRRATGIVHSKLKEHVVDFNNLSTWNDLIKGDVLFSCLGTTLKNAGSKAAQWKIDYDYQLDVAKAAKENKVPQYILVSSGGANPHSAIFYTKMKGKLEEAVKALGFETVIIFNPPLLIRKNTDRVGEKIGEKIIAFFNKMGLLSSQKPLPTSILAKALMNSAKENRAGLTVYKYDKIRELAAKFI